MDRQLLSRATDSSDAPTPGYMYLDIAKNAASNPMVCQEVATYLTRRLSSKNNANVKHKCLKIISKTAVSPYLRGQFKRTISQDPAAMSAIKEALQFRGRPDPVRGDEPYERVRNAAKEALDSIYSDTPADQPGANPPFATMTGGYGNSVHSQSQSSYGGYGNTGSVPPPGGMAGTGGSGRRMEGIGNPMFKDPRLQQAQAGGPGISNMTINDVVREAKDTVVGMIKDPLAKNANVQPNRTGNIPRPGGGYGGPSTYPPGRNELAHQTNGQWTMASNRGPGAVVPPDNFNSNRDQAYFKARDGGSSAYAWAQGEGTGAGTSGGVGGSWASAGPSVASQAREPAYQTTYGNSYQATPSVTISDSSTAMGGGTSHAGGSGGAALSDGSYEKNMIMELCPPGGMKAEPPQDKLAQFARSVSSLNADLVCPALLDCLEDGQPWIIRAKALCVMETCLKFGQKPGTDSNPYADFFHACQAEITPLVSHNRAAIRDPAKRVAKLLGLDGSSSVGPSTSSRPNSTPPLAAPSAPAPPPAPEPNLLDFDSTPPPVPAAPPPAAPPSDPAPASAAAPASLFGGLKVSGASASGASASAPEPAPAAPAAAPPKSESLFDFMAQPSAPAPAAPASASASTVSQTTSMFDNMSLKSTAVSATAESSAPVPAATKSLASAADGTSAFGFINQGPAPSPTPAEAAQPAASLAASTKASPGTNNIQSFDPLNSNMTPNTAKQMMHISPEQMQAMAYQQMMMQRQMQAMAYQQQMMAAQKRGSGTMMPGIVMQNPAAARTSFAFLDKQPQKKDDKSFDFVKDAISSEKKK